MAGPLSGSWIWPCSFVVLVAGTCTVLLKSHMASFAGSMYYPLAWNLVTMTGMALAWPVHLSTGDDDASREALLPVKEEKRAPPVPWYVFLVTMLLHWTSLFMNNATYPYLPGSLLLMLRGFKVPCTAGLSWLFLNRSLQRVHQIGIVVTMLGVLLAVRKGKDNYIVSVQAPAGFGPTGFWCVILLAFLSELTRSAMFVWQEKYVKQYSIPPMKMSGLVGLAGIPFSSAALVLACVLGLEDSPRMISRVLSSSVALFSMIGFLASVCAFEVGGICVTKHSTALTRALLELLRMPCVWVVELCLAFGAWDISQALGVCLIAAGFLIEQGLVSFPRAQGE